MAGAAGCPTRRPAIFFPWGAQTYGQEDDGQDG